MVHSLLHQRDEKRQDKNYEVADILLEKILNAPNDSRYICKINDEYRTWKVWSVESPHSPRTENERFIHHSSANNNVSQRDQENTYVDEDHDNVDLKQSCIDIVQKYQPEKIDELQGLLNNFQGREQ